MAVLIGEVDWDGAVIPVSVGVGGIRRALLERLNMAVPPDVSLRLLIDTGSHLTGFPESVFGSLEITSFGPIPVGTSSTEPGRPHVTGLYDVSVTLTVDGERRCFPSVYAIASNDFGDSVHGILGRDVLDHCKLHYDGPGRCFRLEF